MKMGFRLTVLTALLLSLVVHCESATLTINPPTMSISGSNTGSMTVKCSPPDGTGAMVALNIFRFLINNPLETEIAAASFMSNNGDAQMVTPVPGASVSGSLTERSITVTMTQVSCNDAGMYRCKASYFAQGSVTKVVETTEDKNFTVQVLPGSITLIATPSYSSYDVNASLDLNCNGEVGSTTSGTTQISWVWEYRDTQTYPNFISYMPENDIAPPTPSLPDNSCVNRQSSVLTRRLTLDDAGRTYRCYVRRNGQSFTEFAANYTIGTVGNIGVTSAPNTNATAKSSVGPIVGGVIGGLLLLAIIIVLVYFLWYRKRDKGEKYNTKENSDLPKPADETGPYPSYPPSSIPPSQTRFKGGKNVTEKPKNQDGLHYAELDIVRKAHLDDSHDSISSRGTSQGTIEYASIRLY